MRAGTAPAVASLLAATAFWAGNYVVGAGAVAALDPLSLVLLRWSLAVVPLLVLAQVLERPRWREVARHWPWLLALSGTGLLGYNLLLYTALRFTDAFHASLVNAFNPALITLAAALFLRERLTVASTAGVLLALAGVLVVLSRGDPGALLTGPPGAGDVLMLGAIASWTAYTVLGRRAPRVPPITSTALQALLTVLLLAPPSLAAGGPALPGTAPVAWALVFIAVCPSVLSYLLWNRALRVVPPGRAGVFLNLITVFTALLALAGGQRLQAAQVAGGVVVLAGVALAGARAPARPARGAGGRGR